MIIHFIAAKGSIVREIDNYREIVKYIKDSGHSLARDWVEDYYKFAKGSSAAEESETQVDWGKMDVENMAAISKADIIIAEATERSFFVGYQVAQAVNQKKPVLILARGQTFAGVHDLHVSSDFMKGKVYTPETLKQIIDAFISENTIENKDLRFNFFIDRKIYNYLRWASFKTGKTKAEILRDLVQHEIEQQDYHP